MVETPDEVAQRVVGDTISCSIGAWCSVIAPDGSKVMVDDTAEATRLVIASIIRADRESRAAPDRGTLINAEASAGAELGSAREALRAAKAMDVVAYERAKARLVTAEAKWEEARAALVEAK